MGKADAEITDSSVLDSTTENDRNFLFTSKGWFPPSILEFDFTLVNHIQPFSHTLKS